MRVRLLISLLVMLLTPGSALAAHESADLSPTKFAEISTGVVLVKDYNCSGQATATGSGFLVGDSVVMTARHVVSDPGTPAPCKIVVFAGNQSATVSGWTYWQTVPSTSRTVDVATLKLSHTLQGYLFQFRTSPVPVGTNLAMIGHPLGNDLALTQGRLLLKFRRDNVPILAVDLLGAEGASGSPFVDDLGRVVGILQEGLGGEDVIGQRTAGLVEGIDLTAWWGAGAEKDLCGAYPHGGIANCVPSSAGTQSELLADGSLGSAWHIQSTVKPAFDGACSQYMQENGLVSSAVRTFADRGSDDELTQTVLNYESTAAARAEYSLTTSSDNLSCFAGEIHASLVNSIKKTGALLGFEVHRISSPRLGSAHSAGYIRFDYSVVASGQVLSGRLYWIDTLSGNTYQGFQLWTYDGVSLFPDFTNAMKLAVSSG